MSPVVLEAPLSISGPQATEFFNAVANALEALPLYELPRVYLIRDDDHAVVLSYSANYQPFIGFTQNLNEPDQRAYISQQSDVLDEVAEALDSRRRSIPGGRVFIDKNCAYIKDSDYRHIVIRTLDWPGIDPYAAMLLRYQALERAMLSATPG